MAADKKNLSTTGKKVVQLINQTITGIYQDAININNGIWFPNQDQTKPVDSLILQSTMIYEANKIVDQTQSGLTQDDRDYINQYVADVPREIANNYEKLVNNQGIKLGLTPDYKYDVDPYTQRTGTSKIGILTTPLYGTFMEGRQLNKNISGYAGTNNTYSMCDIVCSIDIQTNSGDHVRAVLGKLQTLSYSIYQQKQPVRVLGNMNAKDYVYGQRTIAGSLVFAVFNRHWLVDIYDELVNKGIMKNWHYIADELPPFDITVSFANEYGYDSKMALYGVRLMTEGQVMSINDIYIENTYQFVAMDIEYMDALNTWQTIDKVGRRWTNTKAAGIIQSNADAKLAAAKKAEEEAAAAAKQKMVGKDIDDKKEELEPENIKQEDLNKSIEAAEKELARAETMYGPESEEAARAREKLESLKQQLNSSVQQNTPSQQKQLDNLEEKHEKEKKALEQKIEDAKEVVQDAEDMYGYDSEEAQKAREDLAALQNTVDSQMYELEQKHEADKAKINQNSNNTPIVDEESAAAQNTTKHWEEFIKQQDEEQDEANSWPTNPNKPDSDQEYEEMNSWDKEQKEMNDWKKTLVNVSDQEINKTAKYDKLSELDKEYERINAEIDQQAENGEITHSQAEDKRKALKQEYTKEQQFIEENFNSLPQDEKPTLKMPVIGLTRDEAKIDLYNNFNDTKEQIQQQKYKDIELLPEEECEARATAREQSLNNQYAINMRKIQDNYPEKTNEPGIVEKATQIVGAGAKIFTGLVDKTPEIPSSTLIDNILENDYQEYTNTAEDAYESNIGVANMWQSLKDWHNEKMSNINNRSSALQNSSVTDYPTKEAIVEEGISINDEQRQTIQEVQEKSQDISLIDTVQSNYIRQKYEEYNTNPESSRSLYYQIKQQEMLDGFKDKDSTLSDNPEIQAYNRRLIEENQRITEQAQYLDSLRKDIAGESAEDVLTQVKNINAEGNQSYTDANRMINEYSQTQQQNAQQKAEIFYIPEQAKEWWQVASEEGKYYLSRVQEIRDDYINKVNETVSAINYEKGNLPVAEFKEYEEAQLQYLTEEGQTTAQAYEAIAEKTKILPPDTTEYISSWFNDVEQNSYSLQDAYNVLKQRDLSEKTYNDIIQKSVDEYFTDDNTGRLFNYFSVTSNDLKTMDEPGLQQKILDTYNQNKEKIQNAVIASAAIGNPTIAAVAETAVINDSLELDKQYNNISERISRYFSDLNADNMEEINYTNAQQNKIENNTTKTMSDYIPDIFTYATPKEAIETETNKYNAERETTIKNSTKNTEQNLKQQSDNFFDTKINIREYFEQKDRKSNTQLEDADDAGNYEVQHSGMRIVNAAKDLVRMQYPLDGQPKVGSKDSVATNPVLEPFTEWGTVGTNCTRFVSIAMEGTPYGTKNIAETTQMIEIAKQRGDYYEPVAFKPVKDSTGKTKIDTNGDEIWDYEKDSDGNILYYKGNDRTENPSNKIAFKKQPGDTIIMTTGESPYGHAAINISDKQYVDCGGSERVARIMNTDPMYRTAGDVISMKDEHKQGYDRPVYCVISTSKYADQASWPAIAAAQQKAGNK